MLLLLLLGAGLAVAKDPPVFGIGLSKVAHRLQPKHSPPLIFTTTFPTTLPHRRVIADGHDVARQCV